MDDQRHPVVQWLIAKQIELDMKNRPFARMLEVDHSLWLRTKSGERGLSMTLLDAAIRFEPELALLYAQVVKSGTLDGN